MPFLKGHIGQLQKLKVPWTWHLVEGLAELKHDTAWSVPNGGRLPRIRRRYTLSTDGTTDYLNTLQKSFPDRVKIYRKPAGQLWEGKIEMVRAPLSTIQKKCLLWQLDSDEMWTASQIQAVVDLFQRQPRRTAAYFWCNFYVGPNAVVSSRHGYSQNPDSEWLRVWCYQPGDYWATHEPPRLMRPQRGRASAEVAHLLPFSHRETEEVGAVFEHYAYATHEQVRFKEPYYGYRGLNQRWSRLQRDILKRSPRPLARYFPWVDDHTMVSTPQAMGLRPMAQQLRGKWKFRRPFRSTRSQLAGQQILLHESWMRAAEKRLGRLGFLVVLQEWSRTGFSRYLRVLEDEKPGLAWLGLKSIRSSKARFLNGPLAGFFLERICRQHCIDLVVLGKGAKPFLTKYLKISFQDSNLIICQRRESRVSLPYITGKDYIKIASLIQEQVQRALKKMAV